jgi:predicted NAD-dependent protein-ADP-ribosyltransferase YbiA (DUF1768 family)
MANCALTPKQEKILLKKVYKDLEEISKSEQDFNLDNYIQEFHDMIQKATDDDALALTYAQLIPEYVDMAFTGEKELKKNMKQKGLSFDALQDKIEEFEDLNAVQKLVAPGTLSQEELKELDEDIKSRAEEPAEKEKPTIDEIKAEAEALEKLFSFRVATPWALTGLQTLRVRQLTDQQIADLFFPYTEYNQAQIDNYRKTNGNDNTQIKDPEQDFYYDFFELFQNEFIDEQDASKIQIKGHLGFKMKIIKNDKLAGAELRADDQELIDGARVIKGKPIRPEDGRKMFNASISAVITNNEGDILYFDETYNATTDPELGRPLYYNIRGVKFENGTYYLTGPKIQSVKEIAENLGITIEEATERQQKELKQLYEVRENARQGGETLLDIANVSRGVLNITYDEKGTRIEDVDFDESDIGLGNNLQNIIIAEENAEEIGETSGGAYISIPGYRSIPIQADNLSSEDIDKLLNLFFDEELVDTNNKIVKSKDRIKLAKHLLYTKKGKFELFPTKNNTVRVRINGEAVEDRETIIDFLNTPYVSLEGNISTIHNHIFGQYAFSIAKNDPVQFEEFEISEDGVLTRREVNVKEHIIKHGSLNIIPNNTGKSKVITFLNGYLTAQMPEQEVEEVEEEIIESAADIDAAKEDITPEEKVKEILDAEEDEELEDEPPMFASRLIPMKSTPAEIAKAKAWWDNHPLSKYIKFEELFDVVNSNAWAEFIDGGIKLYDGSNYTVLYHEAFHAFTQHFLSKKEKLRLYNEAIKLDEGKRAVKAWAKKLGIPENELSQHEKYLAIEELLAEDFRQYMLSGGKKVLGKRPARNSIFRRILNFLKKLFGAKTAREFVTDRAMINIEEIYAKLHVGNINNYSPSVRNSFYGDRGLASRPEALTGKTIDIDEQDWLLVRESIDGLLAMDTEEQNQRFKIENSSQETPYTTQLHNNPDVFLKNAYIRIKKKVRDRRDELKLEVKTAKGTAKEDKKRQLNLLQNVLENWGQYSDTNGILAFHKYNSPYLEEHTKNMDKESSSVSEADKNAVRGWDDANSLTKLEMASDRVTFLMNSIHRYDDKGKLQLNQLGFPTVMTVNEALAKVSSIVGNNHGSPRDIKNALEASIPQNPWVKSLLEKLGPTSTEYTSMQNLWTGVWFILHVSIQKHHSVLITDVTPEGGPTKFEVKSGFAATAFRKVEQDFKGAFKVANHESEYIIDTGQFGNILDTAAIIKAVKEKKINLRTPKGKLKFLNAIGIPLSNNEKILKALDGSEINVRRIFNKIERIDFFNTARLEAEGRMWLPVTDIIQVLRDTIETEVEGESLVTESSNVNKILTLEADFSGNYSSFSVLTAKGNVVQEFSKMSTAAEEVKYINDAKSFDELIAIREMSHLSYDKNPRVTANGVLRALFHFDEKTQTFGDKREGAMLRFDIADGVQNIEDERTDKDFSIATSDATSYDRLMQDLYSMVLEGKPSAVTPADKNTITIITANQLLTGAKSKNVYIDFDSFAKTTVDGTNEGIEAAYNILLPHIQGELKEMALISSAPENLPNIPGFTTDTKDKDGKTIPARGKDFSTFDDVFSTETKKELKKVFAANNILTDAVIPEGLREGMIQDLTDFFNKNTEEVKDVIDELLYVDENLKNIVTADLVEKPNRTELNNIILKAYTVNKFLHNLDHVELFYGSIAQFKDFDKRSPGLNSTARMHRTDQDMMTHLNTVVGRPYQQKSFKPGEQGSVIPDFTPVVNAAIVQDDIIDSEYIQEKDGKKSHYETEIRKDLKKRGLKKAEIDKHVASVKRYYSGMETGDAQGWITFDAYRAFSIAEDRWSPQQEALFQQIVTDPDSVKIGEIAEYFPPRKLQYFGPLATGIFATAFHKFSLLPLIPTMIGENTKLTQLHKMMMEQGIEYATYQTGSKVSTITPKGSDKADNLFNKDGSVNSNMKFTKNPVYLKYLKDQLDINAEFKGKVIFSTQLRKLILEGLTAEGIPTDFMPKAKTKKAKAERIKAWDKLVEEAMENGDDKILRASSQFYTKYKTYENKIGKLIDFRKAQLYKEIGIDPGAKPDMTKIVRFIRKELKHQDISAHELDFIGVNAKGELINDLSVSPSAAQIEKLLNSIVNNRLIRQKVNGEALVQVSNSLFEPSKPTTEDLKMWGQKGLRSYRRDPKTGKTLAMDVKVALQGKFRSLIYMTHADGKKIAVYTKKKKHNNKGEEIVVKQIDEAKTLARLNETIQDPTWRENQDNLDMITMVGVRIPVQGLNSMENMLIKEFLPEAAGNIIVPPIEIVAKSGSDFDIDKLTIMMPNITMIGGSPEIVKESESEDHEKNLKKIDTIGSRIKTLKDERSKLNDEYNEEKAALSDANLSEEDKNIKDNAFNTYFNSINKLKEDIKRTKDLIRNLEALKDPTENNINLKERSEAKLANLQDEYDAFPEEVIENVEFANKEFKANLKKLKEKYAVKRKNIADKINKLSREKASISGGAIENSLLFGIRDILELEENFVTLITPNSTDLVKPLADKLSKDRKYSDKNTVFGKERFSPTRYFEVGYNIYKHESNAVGKETLGLGATGNTWNTIFNRVGAYMKPVYIDGQYKEKYRATILMPHNTRTITKGEFAGQEGISLSQLYDVDGVNKIADVINQLINGWVDVAKDAWIFDIQGNKQVTPILEFLLEAGVTFENAVMFASNPLVKEYVNKQKKAISAFGKPSGLTHPKGANMYREQAKMDMFGELNLKKLLSKTQSGTLQVSRKALTTETLNATKDKNFDLKLSEKIANMTLERAMGSPDARAAFLHYIELEKMANKMSDLKLSLNYDTSKSTSLFDAVQAEAKLATIEQESIFPRSVIKGILDESPIGSFRIAEFQLELWNPLFEIRNAENYNKYLISLASDFNTVTEMKKLYGTEERYIENHKNDLIVKMFTDSVKDFGITDKTYKGLKIEMAPSGSIPNGIEISEDKTTMRIDEKTLNRQFSQGIYAKKWSETGLGQVSKNAFAGIAGTEALKEYHRFVMEREYQRSLMPYDKMQSTHYFRYKANINFKKFKDSLVNLSTEEKVQKVAEFTYEEIIKDKALDNILNYWKLFKSNNTIADQIFEIKQMHPGLEGRYNIVRDLIMSHTDQVTPKGDVVGFFKNPVLRNNRVPAEDMDVYYYNMLELSNPDIISIPVSENETEQDKIENRRIADFFSNLPLVGLIQAGLDTKNPLSIMKAMPMDKITNELSRVKDKYDAILADPQKAREFLRAYTKVFDTMNAWNNRGISRRYKNYQAPGFEAAVPSPEDVKVTPKLSVDKSMDWGRLSKLPVYSDMGVNTMRTENVEEAHMHFGNPFTGSGLAGLVGVGKNDGSLEAVQEAADAYKTWLLTDTYPDVNPEQKAWILEQISSGYVDAARLLYYNKKIGSEFYYSHADALAEVITQLTGITKSMAAITNHSGGAIGADSAWDILGAEYGMVNNKHYWYGEKTPRGNTELTKDEFEEGIIEMRKAAEILGKQPKRQETIQKLARNWFQVKNSTQINAIAPIADDMLTVEGGTGWAVAMAQVNDKEINVFNLKDNLWYKWDGNKFVTSTTPILSQNFAGIGSRQGGKMTEASKQAIRDVYEKTVKAQTKTSPKRKAVPAGETKLVPLINAEDVSNFKAYVEKSGNLPKEFFTSSTKFKEFFNKATGKREGAPQNSTWMLQENEMYDLIDQETGEVLIANVDLRTGKQHLIVEPISTLNIYAGTKENAHLSNFAKRPFTVAGETYQSVEAAYQASKIAYADASAENMIIGDQLRGKITGAKAKSLGNKIKGLDTTRWDTDAPGIMKDLITESFVQNPDALKKLLDTGSAILTHTQDKSIWRTEFPRILMEVRAELGGTNQPTTPAIQTVDNSQLTLWEDINNIVTLSGQTIADTGVTQDMWDSMTPEEQENFKKCN